MIIRTSLIILFIFLAIIVSQFIKGVKLKLMYWMIMILLFITFMNIYMTIIYYISMRNNPGVQGSRGNPGKIGLKGPPGVCTINTSCQQVYDCKNLIQTKIKEKSLEYRKVLKKVDNNVTLNDNDKQILSNVNEYIDLLDIKCKNMNKEELLTELEKSLQSTNFSSSS